MPEYRPFRFPLFGGVVPAKWALFCLLIAATCSILTPLSAQGPTAGSLTVMVTGDKGAPLAKISVSLERGGTALRTVPTDRAGSASFGGVSAGEYSVLIEQFGYQSVRYRGVRVEAGAETRLTAPIALKPPPILSVEERSSNAMIVGGTKSEIGISQWQVGFLPLRQDITDLVRSSSEFLATRDGRDGFLSANGLGSGAARLRVDGVSEALFRNPALPGEPVTAPLFSRSDIASVRLSSSDIDERWSATSGGLFDLRTKSGEKGAHLSPWLNVAPGVAGRSADNPTDSSAIAFQGGVSAGGSIRGDTASWHLRAEGWRLQTGQPSLFEDVTTGSADQLAAEIRAAAQAHGSADPTAWVAPAVRLSTGFSGMVGGSWRITDRAVVTLRSGVASWKESNPTIVADAVNGNGGKLTASDFSTAAGFMISGTHWTSNSSLGIRSGKRDWTEGTLPLTELAANGAAFGSPFTLQGKFKESALEFNEVGSYRYKTHTGSAGFTLRKRTVGYDWTPGTMGRYEFGDLASFQLGKGAFYKATATGTVADLQVKDVEGFLQDVWQLRSSFALTAGVRFNKQSLPAGLLTYDESIEGVTGYFNDAFPLNDKKQIHPFGGFTWDAPSGRTKVEGSAAIVADNFDLVALSEVLQTQTGRVLVQRAAGDIAWPTYAAPSGTTPSREVTFFAPGTQRPRSYKSELTLTQLLGSAGSLALSGGYHHSDYLLRRQDVNLAADPFGTGSDGRTIYGDLKQYGALITPAVGTNRRWKEFDALTSLNGDGFVDHYQMTVDFDHKLSGAMQFHLSYTRGKTNDNLPGQLAGDPNDRTNPFPQGLNGKDWSDGRSDLDIPDRVVASLNIHSKGPLALAARYHYQSGLPFTPGAPKGVDLNGDGSGNNDPAFIGSTLTGMHDLVAAHSCLSSQSDKMAERNSCRDPGIHALDLSLSYALGIGAGRKLALTLDAFNLVGSTTGIYDHAAVRVDAAGSIHRDSSGKLVLPLIANEHFGELLSRRGEPRLLRIGFRVEN